MKLTVVGASAGVGLETVRRALELGHSVTSLSRTVQTLPGDPALTSIAGSALNPENVATALDGAEAVLITLGTGTSTKATTLYSDAAGVLIDTAVRQHFAAPIIAVTGFGAGDSSPYQGVLMRAVTRTVLRGVYENKSRMEEMLAASPLAWEIVRPGRLQNAPRTGDYRVVVDYTDQMKIGTIARADVADYLVNEAGEQVNLRRYPALTG